MPGQGRRSRPEAEETEVLRGGGRGGGRASSDADETAVLPAVDGTAGTRRPDGLGDGAAYIPRPTPGTRAEAWSAFERPSARRSDGPSPAPGETRRAPAVRDPWSEPEEPASAASGAAAASGATHDPHEVTVQLDAVGLQRDNMLHAAQDGPGGGEGSDGPVFVDESGRRSRRFRRFGMAVGLACAVYAVVIVATVLSGNSDAPWLPVEGPQEKPAGKVDTSPAPAESAPQPSATGRVSPGTSPTASTGTIPSPDATVSVPGASPTAENPGTSADPKPSPTKPTADPGTDPTQDPDPPAQPTTGDPDPSPTDGGGPTEEPTDPATTEEPAAGPVANGPSDPTPLGRVSDVLSSAAPSPEYIL